MEHLKEPLKHFKKYDTTMYTLVKTYGPLVSRQAKITGQDRLFATLCESVVSQQLAVKAADVIWGRLVVVSKGKVTPENILKTPLPRLRSAGLSGAKAKTLKALAKASKGGLHLPALRKKSQQEAEAILTEVWGIGPWTSEMFLMFGLQHPDIFSPGDLGLVRSIEKHYNLKNPSRERLLAISSSWSPHRTLACRVLWKAKDTK